MYAGYDWHAVALILVSWYTATAGYAVSASFRPATAAALLLGGVFCTLLLLSGAVAPDAAHHVRQRPPLLRPLR